MHVAFIEDTHLNGGTQIWVTEANRHFLAHGNKTTILALEGSWVVDRCADSGARVVTYDWDRIAIMGKQDKAIWSHALAECDVAICTVHPPVSDRSSSNREDGSRRSPESATAGEQMPISPRNG